MVNHISEAFSRDNGSYLAIVEGRFLPMDSFDVTVENERQLSNTTLLSKKKKKRSLEETTYTIDFTTRRNPFIFCSVSGLPNPVIIVNENYKITLPSPKVTIKSVENIAHHTVPVRSILVEAASIYILKR
jgi:hypothetical protein